MNMESLSLVAVFWPHHASDDAENATVHIEDDLVIYITRADGLEVRLLIPELALILRFALKQS